MTEELDFSNVETGRHFWTEEVGDFWIEGDTSG